MKAYESIKFTGKGKYVDKYSHPSVSRGDWFQDPLQIPKFADAQVPYKNTVLFSCDPCISSCLNYL